MRNIRIFNDKKGLSLIELILSIALLSIILLFLSNSFIFSLNLLGKSAKQKVASMSTAGQIEQNTANAASNNQGTALFQIKFGSTNISSNCYYLQYKSSDNKITYKSYIPIP